jgi:hypothetical protein
MLPIFLVQPALVRTVDRNSLQLQAWESAAVQAFARAGYSTDYVSWKKAQAVYVQLEMRHPALRSMTVKLIQGTGTAPAEIDTLMIVEKKQPVEETQVLAATLRAKFPRWEIRASAHPLDPKRSRLSLRRVEKNVGVSAKVVAEVDAMRQSAIIE